MKIIPAIDLLNGKCVRLTKGDIKYVKTYYDNPLDYVRLLKDSGFNNIHLVDLSAAIFNQPLDYQLIGRIIHFNVNLDFGGGIRSLEDVEKLFDVGVKAVNIGTFAFDNPKYFSELTEKYGSEKIWLSADVKNENIAINGWKKDTQYNLYSFLKQPDFKKLINLVVTDINKDGMLNGANLELYNNLIRQFPDITLIASGGIGKISDIEQLKYIGIGGVIVGKALLENKITLTEIQNLMGNGN